MINKVHFLQKELHKTSGTKNHEGKKTVFITFLLFLFILGSSTKLYAVSKETLESLVDQDRVLSEPIELHLTSDSSPLSNSSVSLNHLDAWLFFDNIKPSVVLENYASSIYINGALLDDGVNGRVAIYSHGTVIMPHSATFKPLTVYTEENFGGTSSQKSIHTYHNELGSMDNAIKSFKLKRGYMVTFANESDGSGYSRVFIADDADLEISVMPGELYECVSFIRIFKHQWVTKKGWCGGSYQAGLSGSTWFYDWQAFSSTTNDQEFVPMRAKLNWSPWSQINGLENVSQVLGLNEPDHPEQHKDDNDTMVVTVDQALEQWPEMLKSGLRTGAPATTSFGWLYDFIDRCDELNYRVDYVAVHSYWGNSAQSYYNNLKYVHERTGRPIWITEWNYGANWTNEWWPDDTPEYTEANANHALWHIREIVNMFDTCSFIERYSIYNWVEDRRAIVLNDTLTKAGEFYANNKSVIAYNSVNEVIPQWNYSTPELSYRYLNLSNSVRLDWNNPNNEMCKGFRLERKISDGDFEIIYTSDDISKTYYLEPFNPDALGNITFRVGSLTVNDDYILSNEVSYYQTDKSDTVQFGKFHVNSFDWNTALFAEKYAEPPLVILGVPSYNNSTPMTNRVNNISTSSFSFQFDPWDYLINPKLTKTDSLSVLALPAGQYDFDGLQAEAKTVTGVKRDWQSITFDKEFSTAPVVFCAITSTTNSIPFMVAVRNVTTTGFEMSLKSEEAITHIIFPEAVNYLAVETGQGAIGKKRITVGQTTEGNGVTSKAVEVMYDSTYSDPVLFAGLLTTEDISAASLRFYNAGDHQFNILKQREYSGAVAITKEDQVGWMIMDMKDSVNKPVQIESHPEFLMYYPNPACNIIHLNIDNPSHAKIWTITGYKLIDKKVYKSIDISTLPEGIYFMKIDGFPTVRFVKQ